MGHAGATSQFRVANRERWWSTKARCRRLLLGKASLLPIGVVAVEGGFDKGELVEIRDGSGRVHGAALSTTTPTPARKLRAGTLE